MNDTIKWTLKKFNELSPYELYAIMQLRNEVFVVEQNCVFQDADDKDQASFHYSGWINEKLIAYSRILPAGVGYNDEVSIGRIVTSSTVRGKAIGRELMLRSIEQINNLLGIIPIRIGAQFYLKKFYTEFGFQQISDIYFEDGIEHIEMIRP